jgi:heat-inducible transcriptional repressor
MIGLLDVFREELARKITDYYTHRGDEWSLEVNLFG